VLRNTPYVSRIGVYVDGQKLEEMLFALKHLLLNIWQTYLLKKKN